MSERIGEGELVVMERVWAAIGPLTSTEIRKAIGLSRGWSGSTVKTVLVRLVNKGILRTPTRDAIPLHARHRPAALRTDEITRFLDRLFDGRATAFLDDIDGLEALLKDLCGRDTTSAIRAACPYVAAPAIRNRRGSPASREPAQSDNGPAFIEAQMYKRMIVRALNLWGRERAGRPARCCAD